MDLTGPALRLTPRPVTNDGTDRANSAGRGQTGPSGKDAKLGAALRANLARRKATARAASAGEPPPAASPENPGDTSEPTGGESDR